MTRRVTAHCHLAHDHERDPAISEAMIRWAAMTLWDAESHGMLT
jgi:hypothetical protein